MVGSVGRFGQIGVFAWMRFVLLIKRIWPKAQSQKRRNSPGAGFIKPFGSAGVPPASILGNTPAEDTQGVPVGFGRQDVRSTLFCRGLINPASGHSCSMQKQGPFSSSGPCMSNPVTAAQK